MAQREHDAFWTSTNRPTGEYAKAINDQKAAQTRRDEARKGLQSFESAVQELQVLTDRLGTLGPRQRAAEEQAEVARQRAKQASKRQRELDQHKIQMTDLRRRAEDIGKNIKLRASLAADLVRFRADLEKQSAQESALTASLGHQEQSQLRLDGEAATAQQQALVAQDLAEKSRRMAERVALAGRVAERTALVQRIDDLVATYRQALATADALPDLSQRALTGLREKATEYRDACVKRDAASTSIVFQTEKAVAATWTTDGQTKKTAMSPGETFEGRTTNLGELHLAGIGTLRVRSGTKKAADLAAEARSAGDALDQALRKLHVVSLEDAQEKFQAKSEAVAASRQATAALTAALGIEAKSDAQEIAAAVDTLHREVAAEQKTLAAIPEDTDSTLDPATARAQAKKARELSDAARSAADNIRDELQGIRGRLAATQTAVAVAKERVQRTADDLTRLPDEAELSHQRDETSKLLGDAVNRENDLFAAWESLGGSEATNESEAKANAAKRLQDELQTAKQRRDNLLGQLRATADQDPSAILQDAEAELVRLTERVATLERQARAVHLLLETLRTVQRETRAALAAPVRAAIEPYLRRIFPKATLLLGEDDWNLTGLSAGETEEPFDQLSLGAREQFALLVRLGLAEVFAQGRRLPLVLDDPLINADPMRRETMIQALRHASRKLQILLFTCHEAEHDTLAAEKTVVLSGGRIS